MIWTVEEPKNSLQIDKEIALVVLIPSQFSQRTQIAYGDGGFSMTDFSSGNVGVGSLPKGLGIDSLAEIGAQKKQLFSC